MLGTGKLQVKLGQSQPTVKCKYYLYFELSISELEGYSQEKILKSVNHPKHSAQSKFTDVELVDIQNELDSKIRDTPPNQIINADEMGMSRGSWTA